MDMFCRRSFSHTLYSCKCLSNSVYTLDTDMIFTSVEREKDSYRIVISVLPTNPLQKK